MLEEMKVKIMISNPESFLRRTNLTCWHIVECTIRRMLEEMKVKLKNYDFDAHGLNARSFSVDQIWLNNIVESTIRKKQYAYFFQGESIRRKSLLDPQTLLLLKSQEESHMWATCNKKSQSHKVTCHVWQRHICELACTPHLTFTPKPQSHVCVIL